MGGVNISETKEYSYLGQVTAFVNTEDKQIDARISAAWKAFWGLKKFFKSFLPVHLKKHLFEACVLPVFTYGGQTWILSEKNIQKLQVAQRAMERSMLNIRRMDRVQNKVLRASTQIKDVIIAAKELKWNWAGHVARYTDERLAKVVEDWTPMNGKRNKGRPKQRWKDQIIEHGSIFWRRKAKDRSRWKEIGTSFIRID